MLSLMCRPTLIPTACPTELPALRCKTCLMASLNALSRVVAVANGKGGVGKTTTACNMAGLAAAAGWKVLLIDFDPQGNCGHILGYKWRDESDAGAHIVDVLLQGKPLTPLLRDVRPNLDVVPGGEALDSLEDLLAGKLKRGQSVHTLLADSLAPVAQDYDLVVFDTPPTRPLLLRLALGATRWIVVPTRPGRTSIEGLRAMSSDILAVRETNPQLELLGVVLYDVETNATVIRRNAMDDITNALGGVAPIFDTIIRHALSPVVESEEKGLLLHEVAERVDSAEPYWKALKEGRKPQRVAGSAPALADDLVMLTDEILRTIAAHEESQEVTS